MSPLSALPPEMLNCLFLHGNALCASTTGKVSPHFVRTGSEHWLFRLTRQIASQFALSESLICLGKSTVMQPLLLPLFLRKEVIQPHLPIRLPCYDFTPVIRPAFGGSFLAVRSPTSGISDSHGVTGGVYKTRERIHRDILIRDY